MNCFALRTMRLQRCTIAASWRAWHEPRVPRRAALCVPASEPTKIAKASALAVDEVVVDLEDAVSFKDKDAARQNIAHLSSRQDGLLSVRVNAASTPWHLADIAVCAANQEIDSIVLPKKESISSITALAARLDVLEQQAGRERPLSIQALVESQLE